MPPIDFNQLLLSYVTIAFALLAVGQTMHVFFCWYLTGKNQQERSTAFIMRMCYEASIVVFLISTAIAFGHYDVMGVWLLGVLIPIEVLSCIGFVPLAFGLMSRAWGNDSRILPVELTLFATPPIAIILNSGTLYLAANALIGTQLVYRIIATIQEDERLRRQTLTRFSIVDAVNLLPSGILCLTGKGHSRIMNEAMRKNLIALELPIDPADLSHLWTTLMEMALTDDHSFKHNDRCLLLSMPDGSYQLFELGLMDWNGEECDTITATDVTEEEELNKLLEQSNNLTIMAGEEIKASLEDVSHIAKNEALLSLRAKVHDIIGQRLSILHRLLEDDNITDESLAEIKPLLNNLLNDLRIESFDAQAELDGIISAFGLIDVDVTVDGSLPAREDVARAFVAVIREATTNAVRHAQAATVRIQLITFESKWALFISNDYSDRTAKPGEGIGIPNMRKAVESLGGTLEIKESPCFIVSARIPRTESEPS